MIYADHAATTPISDDILKHIEPYFSDNFYNPSSQYKSGISAKQAVMKARKQISDCLGCSINEIYFTSGGSESNSWVISDFTKKAYKTNKNIITSKIEHHSLLNACEGAKFFDVKTTYIDANEKGSLNINSFEQHAKNSGFASIQYTNNEIGTIQPIEQIYEICKKNNIILHTDAVQAIGHINIDLKKVDILSASAHKFGGPKGIGFLYVKNGIKLSPLIYGGGQEFGIRGGTENVANIVGMAYALEASYNNINEYKNKMSIISNDFCTILKDNLPDIKLNGDFSNKLESIISVTVPKYTAEKLVYKMDMSGVLISAGSACDQTATGKINVSHVLSAIGLSYEQAVCTVRFSFGSTNNIDDGKKAAYELIKIIKQKEI